MNAPNTSYARTPWWEHIPTTTQPCDDQPVTTTSTAPTSTTTSTVEPEQPTTTTSTVEQPTTTVDTPTSTTVEQPTTTVEIPAPQHRFDLTPAGGMPAPVEAPPNSIHVAVSTPLPQVDAVVVELAPPVSYAAPPTLPHTGSETVATAGIGGLLVAVGLICTALAARTRKATR